MILRKIRYLYRVLHKGNEEREIPEILFQYLGLLSNVFFDLSLENSKRGDFHI